MSLFINFLLQIGILFGLLFMSVWFHELGHWLYFLKILKKKVSLSIVKTKTLGLAFRVGKQEDYKGMTTKEYAALSGWGVFAGLIPLVLLGSFAKELFIFWFLLYVLGCIKDIWNVIQYLKTNVGDLDE